MNEYREIEKDVKTMIDEFLKAYNSTAKEALEGSSLDFHPHQFKLQLPIYILDASQEITFIPTGTKQIPKGIAEFKQNKGKLICITDLKKYNKIFYVDDFQALLKAGKTESYSTGFHKGIGPDFETMGYKISTEILKALIDGLQTED